MNGDMNILQNSAWKMQTPKEFINKKTLVCKRIHLCVNKPGKVTSKHLTPTHSRTKRTIEIERCWIWRLFYSLRSMKSFSWVEVYRRVKGTCGTLLWNVSMYLTYKTSSHHIRRHHHGTSNLKMFNLIKAVWIPIISYFRKLWVRKEATRNKITSRVEILATFLFRTTQILLLAQSPPIVFYFLVVFIPSSKTMLECYN
jgi:hypothetical protein